jgi:hypothetical protein
MRWRDQIRLLGIQVEVHGEPYEIYGRLQRADGEVSRRALIGEALAAYFHNSLNSY